MPFLIDLWHFENLNLHLSNMTDRSTLCPRELTEQSPLCPRELTFKKAGLEGFLSCIMMYVSDVH